MKKITIFCFLICNSMIAINANAQNNNKANQDSLLLQWKQYQMKRLDTAHYYEKDVSQPGSGVYTTELLPIRDTVSCYFEFISGDTLLPGRSVETTWIYGFATRVREFITGFMYDRNSRAKVTILSYKIISK